MAAAIHRDLHLRLAEQFVRADIRGAGHVLQDRPRSGWRSPAACSGSSPKILTLSSLLMPETASLTLSSMTWLNWNVMPGIAGELLVHRVAKFFARSAPLSIRRAALSGTPHSTTLKPFTSVPSSGRPSWLTTLTTSGKEPRISRDLAHQARGFAGRDGFRHEAAHPERAFVQLGQKLRADVVQAPRP